MQNNFIKLYIAKSPHILLMFVISFYAAYIYYGEFRLSQLILCMVLSNLVILMPDYFCMNEKQDEFNMRETLQSHAFLYGALLISLIVMRHLRLTQIDIFGICSLIAFFFLFPIIVDSSRYAAPR